MDRFARFVAPTTRTNEISPVSKLFVSMQGMKFGTWIDTIPPVFRFNNYNVNGLIENPAFVIESIIRDHVQPAIGGIDVTSFDASGNSFDNDNMKLAFSWNSQEPIISRLDEIARDVGGTFTANASQNFAFKRIYQGVVHDCRFTSDDMLGNDSLKIYRTSRDAIYNEIIFRFMNDYTSGSFMHELEISADGAMLDGEIYTFSTRSGFRDGYTSYPAMMTASRTKYNKVRRIEIESRHIRDVNTGVKAFERICDWFSLQRYTLEFDCPLKVLDSDAGHTTADIEAGDFAIVNHSLLPLETSNIAGSGAISDSALFVVTKVIFDPANLTYHFVLRETPYSDIPTDSELELASTGYGARYAESYGDQL